jgi:hypothetical protein
VTLDAYLDELDAISEQWSGPAPAGSQELVHEAERGMATLDLRDLERQPNDAPWRPLVAPAVPAEDWSVCRRGDGSIDEPAEQKRCARLIRLWPAETVLVKAGLRYLDAKFSWEPVTGTPQDFELQCAAAKASAPRDLCALSHDFFEKMLDSHPDRLKVACLLDGIRNGVNIGYVGDRSQFFCPDQHKLDSETVQFLRDDVAKEQKLHKTSPWTPSPAFSNLRVSPMYRVPKTDNGRQVGWRRITDASSPDERAINAAILRLWVRVITFEQVVEQVRRAGRGAKLAKIDARRAFRQSWVRVVDWHLLGLLLDGNYAFDYVLSFGLRSSPGLWDRVASALCWILNEIFRILCVYHVDDYLLLFPEGDAADTKYAVALQVFVKSGTETSTEKNQPPQQQLLYNGVLIDTVAQTLSVSEERRAACLEIIKQVRDSKSVTVRQLQRLAGKLAFLTRVVPPGKVFLNRVLDRLRSVHGSFGRVSVDDGLRADLDWWLRFLPQWPGVAAIPQTDWESSADARLWTDASTSIGMGAVFGDLWISELWSERQLEAATRDEKVSAPYLELLAVATAVHTWAPLLTGRRLIVTSDCQPMVAALNRGISHNAAIADLLRFTVQCCVDNCFEMRAVWIAGSVNKEADLLSRDQVPAFLTLRSTASLSTRSRPNSSVGSLCW